MCAHIYMCVNGKSDIAADAIAVGLTGSCHVADFSWLACRLQHQMGRRQSIYRVRRV